MDHFWLMDAQFAKIATHLPTDTRGNERVDDQRLISGIVQVLTSGGRWSDAPREVYVRRLLLLVVIVGAARTPIYVNRDLMPLVSPVVPN